MKAPNNRAYIQGFPGFGKTRLCLMIVLLQIMSGRRVLVVAPSNTVVDSRMEEVWRMYRRVLYDGLTQLFSYMRRDYVTIPHESRPGNAAWLSVDAPELASVLRLWNDVCLKYGPNILIFVQERLTQLYAEQSVDCTGVHVLSPHLIYQFRQRARGVTRVGADDVTARYHFYRKGRSEKTSDHSEASASEWTRPARGRESVVSESA